MRAVWNRKEGSDAPQVGETVRGGFKPQGKGQKFNLDRDGEEFTIKSVTPGEQWSNDYGKFDPYDCEFEAANGFHTASSGNAGDDRQRSIIRQHSQEMSLRLLAIKYPPGQLPDDWREQVKAATDFFAEDAS